eukprot:5152479-Amphidinium_carterae.1
MFVGKGITRPTNRTNDSHSESTGLHHKSAKPNMKSIQSQDLAFERNLLPRVLFTSSSALYNLSARCQFKAGQRVPADVRILACSDAAMVDNSALTGLKR